jgi:hypothetical protein
MIRRHILVYPAGGNGNNWSSAVWDGSAWSEASIEPHAQRPFHAVLPPMLELAIMQGHDLTVSPRRSFKDLGGGDPADIGIPLDVPVMIACPVDGSVPHFTWTTFFDPEKPPLKGATRFVKEKLADEFEAVFGFNAHREWNRDREIWLRHDWSLAELLPEPATSKSEAA